MPGGAALLVEAANMGDADAQYELACRLRVENEYVQSDQQAFHYLEKAVDQNEYVLSDQQAFHYLGRQLTRYSLPSGCCVSDQRLCLERCCLRVSDLWCFHRASEKGHAGAAIAYGSLLLQGVEVPESVMNLTSKRGSLARKARKNAESLVRDQAGMARERFQIAAKAGCDLGLKWLERLDEEEKHLLTENEMVENAQEGKKVC
ncbi:uncharacterized protein LOC112183501 [Rosa chinensis]|uniref:uncharacterized protein LOC112183501 n=1 Tax=Rosa chinensis TaxID=74649 RepID=UPI000D0877DD|nr:uncharacterized protein LOC112183501 [Rosa chinensis]